MAKTAKTGGSTKVFGGTSLPEGKYAISRIIVCEEFYTDSNGVKKSYDALTVCVKPATQINNVWVETPNSQELDTGLILNGCWRTRYDAQGQPHKATGTFIESAIQDCHGQSFDQTVTTMTTNGKYIGKVISLSYEEYQSVNVGSAGRVPVVNFL